MKLSKEYKKQERYYENDLEIEEAVVVQSFSRLSEDITPDVHIAPSVAKKSSRIVLYVAAIVVIAMGILGFRTPSYRQRAEANITRSVYVPAVRGAIYDRFGQPLLENIAGFRLVILPSILPHEQEERVSLFKTLAAVTGMTEEEILQKLHDASLLKQDEVVLSRDITLEQAIYLKAYDPPGVRVIDEVKRKYLDGEMFSHIVGYTGSVSPEERSARPELHSTDAVGKTGLEGYYDAILRGEGGMRSFVKNFSTRSFEEAGERDPVAGHSLYTTIDADFQRYFYERFQAGLNELGRQKGLGIALNPQNGEILSLVSFPSYDNNWFASPSLYTKEITRTLQDARMPLFNRAISGLYNPGSIIKPLVAFAALKERIIDPRRVFEDPGYLLVPNPYNPETPSVFVDWAEHGPVDMRKAIAVSANVYFYIIGGGTDFQKGLGIAKLIEYFSLFHLNTKLGIDLLGEEYGRMPAWNDPERTEPWRLGDTYNVSIGQGELRLTPLGIVSSIAGLANGGTMYQPYIVKSIRDSRGNVVEEVNSRILEEGIGAPDHIAIVKEGMRDVVQKPYGTGFFMSDVPFPAAGKSGTAQVGNKKTINALFTAFAPVERPRIAILVLVENAREGGRNALPIAKDVLMWYYTHRGFNNGN